MWPTLVIPALTLRRLRQEDCSEFKTSLGYRVRLKKTPPPPKQNNRKPTTNPPLETLK